MKSIINVSLLVVAVLFVTMSVFAQNTNVVPSPRPHLSIKLEARVQFLTVPGKFQMVYGTTSATPPLIWRKVGVAMEGPAGLSGISVPLLPKENFRTEDFLPVIITDAVLKKGGTSTNPLGTWTQYILTFNIRVASGAEAVYIEKNSLSSLSQSSGLRWVGFSRIFPMEAVVTDYIKVHAGECATFEYVFNQKHSTATEPDRVFAVNYGTRDNPCSGQYSITYGLENVIIYPQRD